MGHFLEQGLKILRADVGLGGQAQAERQDELVEVLELVHIGLFVDAVDQRHVLFAQELRRGLVGGQHEFLDQFVRFVVLGDGDSCHPALPVKGDLAFR